jgi:hypothetical protein
MVDVVVMMIVIQVSRLGLRLRSLSRLCLLFPPPTSPARVLPVNDAHTAQMAFHSPTNTRTKKIRLSKLFTFDFDRIDTSEEGGVVDRSRNVAIVIKSAGDEFERLGVDRSRECWGGGEKRKDLVNQVFTRLRDALEVPSVCKLRTPPSVRNVVRSSEGVDGGA